MADPTLPKCSEGCGALFCPSFNPGTADEVVVRWTKQCFSKLWEIMRAHSALLLGRNVNVKDPGIAVVSGYEIFEEEREVSNCFVHLQDKFVILITNL